MNAIKKVSSVSKKCVDLIKSFEGYFSKPYLCPAGVPTIGYGTILYPNGKRVSLRDEPCTELQAEEWLMYEVNMKARKVDAMTTDGVTQNQFDALVSFAYNLGEGALQKSTLLRKVNSNPNDESIKAEFMRWVNANGKKLGGLVRRRAAESDLYFTTTA